MANNDSRVVGYGECPACLLKGVPQEERMSFLGGDDRVSCMVCNHCSYVIPMQLRRATLNLPTDVRNLLAALIGSTQPEQQTFALRRVGNQADELAQAQDFSQRAAAIVAQGHDASVLDVTSIGLASVPYAFQTIDISYTPRDLEVAALVHNQGYVDLAFLNDVDAPQSVHKAVGELITHGFRPTTEAILMGSTSRRVVFVKGTGDGRNGIKCEVQWLL